MAVPIKLAINRQSRQLVYFNGSATAVPPLFQSNNQDFQIQIVDPDPSGRIGGLVAVDMAGTGLRVAIGATPTGSSGGPSPLALQDSAGWTWDAVNKWFTGSLALNTTDVDTYIGSSAFRVAYLEVNSTLSGSRITLLQASFNLTAVVDELTSTTPSSTEQYLTRAECLALFAKLVNDLGTRIVFKSANGLYGREIGVGEDGGAVDNFFNL